MVWTLWVASNVAALLVGGPPPPPTKTFGLNNLEPGGAKPKPEPQPPNPLGV